LSSIQVHTSYKDLLIINQNSSGSYMQRRLKVGEGGVRESRRREMNKGGEREIYPSRKSSALTFTRFASWSATESFPVGAYRVRADDSGVDLGPLPNVQFYVWPVTLCSWLQYWPVENYSTPKKVNLFQVVENYF
jgi:hypothetical protein